MSKYVYAVGFAYEGCHNAFSSLEKALAYAKKGDCDFIDRWEVDQPKWTNETVWVRDE